MSADPRPVILVVDDTLANLGVLFELLDQAGFEVLVAEDGESALQHASLARPDLILLDVLMPDMDGFATCERLKADPALKETPVIFMTALSDTVDKVRGFDVGAVDYVTKPFQAEELLARVRAHLTIRRLRVKLQESEDRLSRIFASAVDAIVMKALAKLEPVALIEDAPPPVLRLPQAPELSPPLVALERASVGYEPGQPVLSRLDLRLDPDDRIALGQRIDQTAGRTKLRYTEVQHLCGLVGALANEDDVIRLEISVNDVFLVRGANCGGDVADDSSHPRESERAFL